MVAFTDGWVQEPATTHSSTRSRRYFGDLPWAKEVNLDANSEYQPGKVSKVIKRLLLLQGIWSPLSSEPLWNGSAYISTRFWGKSPVTPTLSPVAPKEADKHPMGILAQINKASDMDLSNWDITCTEFRPRKRKRASKSISVGAYPASPPATESVKKEHKCFNCGKPDHFACLCKQPRHFNPEPPTTQVQVDDDISPQP